MTKAAGPRGKMKHTMTDQETIQYLWDVIDKIHAAADDARLGIPGAASALPGYVEYLARQALMTVKRPAAQQPPEPSDENETVLGEV